MASTTSVLAALNVPQQGRSYDLASQWWRHMPVFAGYPQFEVVTYNSPHGERLERRFPFNNVETNEIQFGYFSEIISGSLHTGTHIDALSHVTCGTNNEWHGGVAANDSLGNFGSIAGGDASQIPPIIGRGILLDIPPMVGATVLPPHFEITAEHLEAAATAAGLTVGPDDVVLVRTGQMRYWPDTDKIGEECAGSGVGADAAEWLAARGVRYTGADTQSYEVRPSQVTGNPLPVHITLLHNHGIHIMEWVNCEELSADGVSQFLFVALPLSIRGGSGSPIRPIAIV
jgi:kynurenine formamidase